MRISFQIAFKIKDGEKLFLVGNMPEIGNWNEEEAVEVISIGGGNCRVDVQLKSCKELSYRYFIKDTFGNIRREVGAPRNFKLPEVSALRVRDCWMENNEQKRVFSSSLFREIAKSKIGKNAQTEGKIKLRIFSPVLQKNEVLCVVGDCKNLGEWNAKKALPLSIADFPCGVVSFDIEEWVPKIAYKYIIKNRKTGEVFWEEGENREFSPQYGLDYYILNDVKLRFNHDKWKGVGISIPIFSLRTNGGFGVGEFYDLKKMVDWCVLSGIELIQTLPINDTISQKNKQDSYPYNPISSYALHPMYLNIPSLVGDNWEYSDEYYHEKDILNKFPAVDYERVVDRKFYYLQKIYETQKGELWNDDDFVAFVEKNKEWLAPYGTFCYLRDKYGTANFENWEEGSSYDEQKVNTLTTVGGFASAKITFYYFLQYHLDKQLQEAVSYARNKGVVLKGDLPIGISRKSVEIWQNPELFNEMVNAGAPPDFFSTRGQNWGFPTYNWDKMESNNFRWWKKRLSHLSNYFDAYRIDHILGFFRIWSIPQHAEWGVLGHFEKAIPYSRTEICVEGIPFFADIYCSPYIIEESLRKVCGQDTPKIKRQFLYFVDEKKGIYTLKTMLDTQKKIKDYFKVKPKESTDAVYEEYLLNLATEVLFVRDREDMNTYHPRINMQKTAIFSCLPRQEQEALRRLHDNFYYKRHNTLWKQEASKKFRELLPSSGMLACGEDLGMLSESVFETMDMFKILSLEIERMPKIQGVSYTDLSTVPYLSVSATSTHDTSPLRLWWEEMTNEERECYVKEKLDIKGDIPTRASVEICTQIVENHLSASSMLVVLPIQDWLSMDEKMCNPNVEMERINVPNNPNHYWQYRMHLPIEELLESKSFNDKVQSLIRKQNR